MELLIPAILASVITMMLIPFLERRAGVFHVLDAPGERKVHDRPIPRVGGIAMAIGAAVALAFWLPLTRQVAAFAVGALIVLLFGVWDDRRELSPWAKLTGQLFAVAVVVFVGGVDIHSVTLTSRIELPQFVSVPLTFLFLVGVTNAINLADGLDGLAGGTTLLCFAAIGALSVGGDVPFITVVACVMIGSLLGFLRFNTFPARVFMGDGGSQLLGFTAGVLAVLLTQLPEFAYSAALPILLLGLPILDTLTVMVRRVAAGRSPFSADDRHLHHLLLARGFDHFESVALIYLLQALLFVMAWFARYQSDVVILSLFAGFATVLLSALHLGKRTNWQWRGVAGATRIGEFVADRVPWLKAPSHLPRWGNLVAWALVTAYLLGVAVTSTRVSRDVAWLAVGLSALLLSGLFRLVPSRATDGLMHVAAFVAPAIAVYLDHIEISKSASFTAVKWVLFPALLLTVVVRLRFWRERRFEITTLDVLVVFLALVLPNLPGLHGAPSNLGLSITKMLLLMYAAEILIRHSERTRRWLWSSSSLALAVVGVRGLAHWIG